MRQKKKPTAKSNYWDNTMVTVSRKKKIETESERAREREEKNRQRYNWPIARTHTMSAFIRSFVRAVGRRPRYESIDQLGLFSAFIFSLVRIIHSHLAAAKVYRISYLSHSYWILMECADERKKREAKRNRNQNKAQPHMRWCAFVCVCVWSAKCFLLWHLFFMRAIDYTTDIS